MSNRNKGAFKFAANFEVTTAEALDPRMVVDTKDELIKKDTWPYKDNSLYVYGGLLVSVKNEQTIYMLVDTDKILDEDYSGWKRIDWDTNKISNIEKLIEDTESNLVTQFETAISGLTATVSGATTGTTTGDTPSVAVEVKQEDGKLTEVTVVTTDIASATALGELSTKVGTESVETQIGTAISGLDSTVSGTTTGDTPSVAVEVKQEDGKLTEVTVTTNDIASATALGELSAKVGEKNVETQIGTAISGLTATVSGATTGDTPSVAVEVKQENGKLTEVTVTTNDIASATALGELSEKIGTDSVATQIDNVKSELTTKISNVETNLNKIATVNKQNLFNSGNIEIQTTSAIPVIGGPLAEMVKKVYGDEIPVNTKIEEILMRLICEEKWDVTPTFTEGKVSSTFPNDYKYFTLGSENKTVEVGTQITLGEVTITAATPTVSGSRKYTGFKYGYSWEDDSRRDSDSTEYVVENGDASLDENGEYKMVITYKKFGNKSQESITSKNLSEVKFDSKTLTVDEEENSVTVQITGPKAYAKFNGMEEVYACSNLGNTSSTNQDPIKTDKKDEKTIESTNASKTITKKITGKRYMFWGSRTVADELDSGKIRDLDNSQEAQSGVFTINQKPQGAYQFVVAIPKASNLTLVSAKNATSMDDETINKFEMSQLPVNGENSYATAEYNVYVFTSKTAWADGDKKAFTITIN